MFRTLYHTGVSLLAIALSSGETLVHTCEARVPGVARPVAPSTWKRPEFNLRRRAWDGGGIKKQNSSAQVLNVSEKAERITMSF